MVRESRYLWIGNLPENIHEDRIKNFFVRSVLQIRMLFLHDLNLITMISFIRKVNVSF
jgi:RNA recognition motif-containing protein